MVLLNKFRITWKRAKARYVSNKDAIGGIIPDFQHGPIDAVMQDAWSALERSASMVMRQRPIVRRERACARTSFRPSACYGKENFIHTGKSKLQARSGCERLPCIIHANEKVWEHWLERLYNLRRDKRGSHERPHKPVLLLSIIDLLDRGIITRNEIPLSEELVATFKRYFEVVRKLDDQPTIENPFFHLSGDKFWHLIPQPDHKPLYQEGFASGPPSVGQFRKRVAFAEFDAPLWVLFRDDVSRHQLREALIARYFPEERERLAAVTAQPSVEKHPVLNDALPPAPVRDAAFRKTILEVYDYRCAACGVRVLLEHSLSLVEAAHLIPFNESFNDKPTNGVALCPNHHWAMDRLLIAPCPDEKSAAGVWRINRARLDKRIEGQRDLVALDREPVIAPSERKFYPAMESLLWREKTLAGIANVETARG